MHTNLILVLRSELMCLIVLVFIALASKRYKLSKDNINFARMLIFGLLHICFDIITVITVNNVNVIPAIVNKIFHVLFYLTALLFSIEFLTYVMKKCSFKYQVNITTTSYIFVLLYAVGVWFLEIEYMPGNGTYSSTGTAAYIGYALAFINFFFSFFLMILYRRRLKENIMVTLFPMTFIAIIIVVVQSFLRELLFTGAAITIIIVGLFFSNENPAQVFQQRSKLEAISSLKTKRKFFSDLNDNNNEFLLNKSITYIIARFSVNNVPEINEEYGHVIGDDYISIIINCAVKSFSKAFSIYRLNGDEFGIIYKDIDEKQFVNDIISFNTSIKINTSTLPYLSDVSIGYCVSNDSFDSLFDVKSTADYHLYKSIKEARNGIEAIVSKDGKENMAGLDNFMFDAFLLSSNNDHPYILNLKTNVMRITPKWKDEFGLSSDILYDLPTLWINKIHPDDRQKFIDDFTATVNGAQSAHHCDYRAINKDGVYIKCSCHGSVYKTDDGISVFAGHMYTLGEANNS